MNQGAPDEMSSEINVTPMIDVLLVLLIIFMLIVPTLSSGESVLTPKPAKGDRTADGTVVLEVLSGNGGQAGFRINQQNVSREELPARLAAIYANRTDRVLFVKADDKLAFTQVATAIDVAHAAGVDRVGLLTPGIEAGI
jgi:biopolymer transport protein ExbD